MTPDTTQSEKQWSPQLPSCEAIGLQAKNNGNFKLARQMFQSALKQLEDQKPNSRAIDLMIGIGETYLDEGSYDQAKAWFEKAMHSCEKSKGTTTFKAACCMAKMAEAQALVGQLFEFTATVSRIERTYLLSPETDFSILLNALIDLSWVLCINGLIAEVRQVNFLIAQIKQLDQEERIGTIAV